MAHMRELFHPDGTIEAAWFERMFSEFVDTSARMCDSKLWYEHVVAMPVITSNDDRAIAETHANDRR